LATARRKWMFLFQSISSHLTDFEMMMHEKNKAWNCSKLVWQ